jgi:hypothetical protein
VRRRATLLSPAARPRFNVPLVPFYSIAWIHRLCHNNGILSRLALWIRRGHDSNVAIVTFAAPGVPGRPAHRSERRHPPGVPVAA